MYQACKSGLLALVIALVGSSCAGPTDLTPVYSLSDLNGKWCNAVGSTTIRVRGSRTFYDGDDKLSCEVTFISRDTYEEICKVSTVTDRWRKRFLDRNTIELLTTDSIGWKATGEVGGKIQRRCG